MAEIEFKPHMAQAPDELKTNEYLNSFDGWGEVGKKALELREEVTTLKSQLDESASKAKNLVRIPDEEATDEEKAAFRQAMRIPNAKDEYKILNGDKEMTVFEDERLVEGLRDMAYEGAFTQEQAGMVAKFINDREIDRSTVNDGQRKEDRKALEKQLYDKYKDDLPKEIDRLREFMVHYAPKAGVELLKKFNLDNNYEITTFLMEFADQFAEDNVPKGDLGGAAPPMEKGMLEYATEGME